MAQEFSRTQRVAGQMQRELAQIIQQELHDPRVGIVTLSAVEVTKDLSHAKVFVTFMNPEQDVQATLKVLNKAAGFLRRVLGQRMLLRALPELHFFYDDSLDKGTRVSALLNSVRKNDDSGKDDEEVE